MDSTRRVYIKSDIPQSTANGRPEFGGHHSKLSITDTEKGRGPNCCIILFDGPSQMLQKERRMELHH
ncbi:hypothetical protein PRUPE_6G255000 [Prunus persica]|uniref:Uncharacterized protein n=1 Tax=Prunus persica TaxID=3760 RepID=A0A251NVT3_PRUPE|nr:hypothetical protein PRUPE_6G255000 [Prunus persica]